jgi:hypothetical protein
MLTPEQAIAAVRDGQTVRVQVGTDPEDPTLLVSLEDECVMSESIAGWSAGVVEPVCAVGSDFLRTYFDGRASLTLATAYKS